jgi:hypothetical protein
MDKPRPFEQNLRALSLGDPALSTEIARAGGGGKSRYRFMESRSGQTIPAIIDGEGRLRPLHSTVDPKREASRLVSSLGRDESFLVFFGLGGGFHAMAALERAETGRLIIVEYGLAGLAELFSVLDYRSILEDGRVSLLVDQEPAALEDSILRSYLPALSGGFRLLPLRARTEASPDKFVPAGEAVRRLFGTGPLRKPLVRKYPSEPEAGGGTGPSPPPAALRRCLRRRPLPGCPASPAGGRSAKPLRPTALPHRHRYKPPRPAPCRH